MAETPYTGWAMLELMGHRVRVGWVYEAEAYGGKLLAIDLATPSSELPGTNPSAVHRGPTEYYGATSIYSLRPMSEEIVRDHLRRSGDPRPVQPMQYRLPSAGESEAERRDLLHRMIEPANGDEFEE